MKAWNLGVSVRITEEDLVERGLPVSEDGAKTLALDWLEDQIQEGGMYVHGEHDPAELIAAIKALGRPPHTPGPDINDPRYGQTLTAEDRRKLDAFPDLLAALHAIVAKFESDPDDLETMDAGIKIARAAIAKAEGRSPILDTELSILDTELCPECLANMDLPKAEHKPGCKAEGRP